MKVTIYTTNCVQCKALESLLKRKSVEFSRCDDVDLMLQMGMTSAPHLEVDGNLMNYGEALKWVNEVAK